MATPVLTASGASSANNGTGNFDLSFTPEADKQYLYLVGWLADGNANANQQPSLTMSVPTGSGNLTATPALVLLNDTQGDDTWETGCVVYKLQAAASPSGTSTLRLSPGGIAVYQWQGFIVEVVDPDETLANIVAQSAEGQTNTIDAGAHTYNLAGSPTSGRTLVSFSVVNDDTSGTTRMTPTTDWSELTESDLYPRCHIQWRDDTTSTTCTIPQVSGSNGNANGITVELVTATEFGPASLTPEYWFDASAITGLNDGDGISQWDDLSGNARHVTQGTSGNRPTYQTNELNGLPVVRFDGTNDRLVHAYSSTTLAKPLTIAAVFKRTGTTERQYLYDSEYTSTNADFYRNLLALYRSGAFGIYAGTDTGVGWVTGGTPDTNWHIALVTVNGSDTRLEIDGRHVVLSGAARSANGMRGLVLGANFQQNLDFFQGDLAEFVMVSGLLGPVERADLVDYLSAKWGIDATAPIRPAAVVGSIDAGTEKWAYGVHASNGVIYAPPYLRGSWLKIDPTDDSLDEVTVAGSNWYCIGAVEAADGRLFSPSSVTNPVRTIDTADDSVDTVGSSQTGGFYEMALADNASMYGAPITDQTAILKVTPSSDTVTTVGSLSGDWGGAVAVPGAVYFPPRDSGKGVLKLDTSDDSITELTSVTAGVDRAYSEGVQDPVSGRIYFCPKSATNILVLDPSDDSMYTISGIPAGGDKWGGSLVGPDGLIYFFPRESPTILIVDPSDDSFEIVPYGTGGLSTGARLIGAVRVGSIAYSIPFKSPSVVKWTWSTTATSPYWGVLAS